MGPASKGKRTRGRALHEGLQMSQSGELTAEAADDVGIVGRATVEGTCLPSTRQQHQVLQRSQQRLRQGLHGMGTEGDMAEQAGGEADQR